MGNRKQENIEAFDRLLEGQEELLEFDEAEMEKELKALYPNIDEIAHQQWLKTQGLLFKQKIAANKEKSKQVGQHAAQLNDRKDAQPQRTMEVMMTMLQCKERGVQFNKLEDWTEETIQEIFEDFEILAMLEQLNKEE